MKVTLQNLTKKFPSRNKKQPADVIAVNDFTFEIPDGVLLGLLGPSGCGKSTLAHCVNGLIPNSYPGKTTGTLTVGGRNAEELSLFDLSKVVGTVLQDSDGQFIGLTVAEDMAFALENDCMDQKDMKALVDRVAQLVGVSGVLGHAPYEISGGQKQRVAIARAIAAEPPVILADEPTGNLDSNSTKEIMDILKGLHNEGRTVILITHDNDIAAQAKRVIKIKDGKVESDSGQIVPVEELQTAGA